MNERQTRTRDSDVVIANPLQGSSASFGGEVAADENVKKKPLVFISYSHEDEDWKDRLYPHLEALERQGRITIWNDRDINAGEAWNEHIQQAMDQAQTAICLISADYLASGFCIREEMPRLLERQRKGELGIIPVLVRPCAWTDYPWLAELQMLPRDGKAVASDFRDDYDKIFKQVAERVRGYREPLPPTQTWWKGLIHWFKRNGIRVAATGLVITAVLSWFLVPRPVPDYIHELMDTADAHVGVGRTCGPAGSSAWDAYQTILKTYPDYRPARKALVKLDCDSKQ